MRSRRGSRRSWRSAVLLLAAGAPFLLVSCAGVPDSGPVRDEKALPLIAEPDDVRVLAESAHSGQSPVAVVRGFLRAAASFEDNHAVARTYLDRQASSSWSTEGAVVYDDGPQLRVVQESANDLTAVVRLTAHRVAELSADGTWRAAAAGHALTEGYRLVKRDSEWRIVSPPKGLRLTVGDIERSFRAVSIYFLGPAHDVVVPDHRYLPVERRALSTALVRALLLGPSKAIAPAVRTAVPVGTKLIGTAPVVDGVVTVDLTRSVLDAEPRGLVELSAQLVWTLRELGTEFSSLRLLAEGAPLRVPGVAPEQPAAAWEQFDPDEGAQTAVFRNANRELVTTEGEPIPGPLGTGALRLDRAAFGPGLTTVAGIAKGTELYLGPVQTPRRVRAAQSYLAPSFDYRGRCWVVEQRDGVQRALVFDGAAARPVGGVLPTKGVTALRLSRDGTRVAVVSAGRLLVGVIVEAANVVRIERLVPIATSLTQVVDVGWSDSSDLIVLARAQGASQRAPWFVSSDGYRVQEVPVAGDGLSSYQSLAVGPGTSPLLVADSAAVYRYSAGRWHRLGFGDWPTYPG